MNLTRSIRFAFAVTLLTVSLGAQTAAEQSQTIRFHSSKGSKLAVHGGFGAGEWKAQTSILSGFIEGDSTFLSGAQTSPSTITAELFVPVRSLQSVGQNWEPYNEQINSVVYKQLRADEFPKICFHLSELSGRGSGSPNRSSLRFESRGDLVIAGVTNRIAIPVEILVLPSGGLKISGQMKIRMSDFKLRERALDCFDDPDTVYLDFEWCIAEKKKH
jgi:hypothetical protein